MATKKHTINLICEQIRKLTDDDFAEVEQMIKEQKEYVHPLKMGKAAKLHAMGNNNDKIVKQLKELKATIELGGK